MNRLWGCFLHFTLQLSRCRDQTQGGLLFMIEWVMSRKVALKVMNKVSTLLRQFIPCRHRSSLDSNPWFVKPKLIARKGIKQDLLKSFANQMLLSRLVWGISEIFLKFPCRRQTSGPKRPYVLNVNVQTTWDARMELKNDVCTQFFFHE